MVDQLINDYRSLLWAAVFLLITGGYLYTTISIVSIYKEMDTQSTRILILDREIREVRERQIKALAEREATNKEIFGELDRLKKK